MSLDASLAVASGGLLNINRHLAVVSQNVANVGTQGYARQVLPQESLAADGQGMGVRSLVAERAIDRAVQTAALAQRGSAAGAELRRAALAGIDVVHGTPGAGGDLPALLGRLHDRFTTLAADPASQPRQASVIAAAADLARQINALDRSYLAARQEAHDGLVRDAGRLNTALADIGALGTRIVGLRALGQSTADLESQRDAAKATVSDLIAARFLDQPNGDVLVVTGTGLSLPTRFDAPPFVVDAASITAAAHHPGGGLPGVMLNGADVTARLGSGRLAAHAALRDDTLPTFQAELDEFARTLAVRFDDQGLRLFSDPLGSAPPPTGAPVQAAYVGYAGIVGVNPAVAAEPALVRDGTHAVAATPGGADPFTPNPPGGPAGFTTLAQRILDHSFGSEIRPGLSQPAAARSGLGPAGTLASPYVPPAALAGLASALVEAQGRASADATAAADSTSALQTMLADRLAQDSAVSIDQEMTVMIQLQSAYAANARVIAAVQTLMDQTLQMVR